MFIMYSEKLRSLIKLGALGVIGGLLFGFFAAKSDGADFATTMEFMFAFALMFAGFPYGFIHAWRVLCGIIPLNFFTLFVYVLIGITLAYLIAIIVYPLMLIYTAIQYFRYKKKEKILY